MFCDELVRQELDDDTAYVDIPEPVLEMYRIYRPSPLCRAYNLEKALGTPAKIYYKFEGNNTSGSHKLNSAIAQAYYAKAQDLDGITTETGAGQWGTALAEASAHFGLNLDVFMVKCSYEQKPFRRNIMETFDAHVTPSPSDTTEIGRKMLAEHPDSSGSLGTAISEAVERALNIPGNKGRYTLGSVLNQVVLHQSVIGLESYAAFEELGEYPDVVIGCAGGGSNLGGLMAPFMRDKIKGVRPDTRFVAVEPASCPSLTRGRYAYDFADTGRTCPLAKMYTLGNGFLPSPDHAGGLRYHGMSPIVSKLKHDGYLDAVAVKQTDVFAAAVRVRAARDHPAGSRERPRHLPGRGGGQALRRDGRGEDDPLRPHGHGLLRHEGLRRVQPRRDERPCPHRRGAGGRASPASRTSRACSRPLAHSRFAPPRRRFPQRGGACVGGACALRASGPAAYALRGPGATMVP